MIKANHNIRFTDTASKRFENNLINISFQNLKIGLEEEKIFLESCKCEFRNSKIRMHSTISEVSLHTFIENRLKSDQSRLKKQFYNMHKNKLVFLLTKNDKPIPNFLKDQSPNVTNGSKKSRKFIRRTRYRRKIKQLNRRKNCLVINYSDIELSKDMISLLNRGLNFAIIPKKVNTTDVHAGFEKLSRSMKWKEAKYKEDDNNKHPSESMSYKKEPWRKSKTNLPLSAPSADLSTMLNGSLACVLGSDLNKIQTNLPVNEKRALDKLVLLQKERHITLKPTDKTGGVAVFNTDDYIKGMESLLHTKFTDSDGIDHPFFQPLNAMEADQMQFNDLEELKSEVKKAKDANIITSEVADWLVPEDYAPGRLYGLSKDHVAPEKWPEGSTIPPFRPVESASGTTFENASHFVDLHANDLVKKLPSYWQDTSHMLRDFEKENERGPQPPGTIPVTLDVTSLYTNIPLGQGIEIFEAYLDTREDKKVPTSFLIKLLQLVLTCNILVFDSKHYLQRIGTAMGTRVAPTFACLFMGVIEFLMLRAWKGLQPNFYKRYIDDCFFFWTGSEQELLAFINHLNNFHPFLKFKASYNFVTRSVDFLDTVISINDNGLISTTLYVKPGKRNNLLLTSSCHPNHIFENIPYSSALRLKRICSLHTDFLELLDVLKSTLMDRGYKCNYIMKAYDKVVNISRSDALKKVEKNIVIRPVLPLIYDPRLPNISNILYRFWKVMIKNPILKKIFPEPPMVCWKRPKNLREFLIKAKLPKEISIRRSNREKLGFKHCGKNCMMCKYSPKFANSVVSSVTKEKIPILSNLTCKSENVLYCITCMKSEMSSCAVNKPQYVGQTSRPIVDRFREHKSSIVCKDKNVVGTHFSQNNHDLNNFQIVPFEQVRSSNPWIRISREKFFIRKINPSLNKRI